MDPRTREQVNMSSKNGNWLTKLIFKESTYDGMNQKKLGIDYEEA